MTKKLALLLAMALVTSCLFAGLTMAQEATATADAANAVSDGSESAGDSADMDWEAYFTELFASAGTESADGEEAESTGEEGESEMTEADIMAFIMTALGLEEYADFDFEAFYADIQERVENGEELTMEEAFPEFYWEFYTNMFDGSEEDGYTVDLIVEDNSMMMYWIFLEELDEDAIDEVVTSVSESFESEETMANLKSAMESMAESYNIDIDDIEMGLVFINGDDEEIYEMIYTYADLEDVEVPETDEEGGSSDSSASSASEAAEEAEAAVEETEAE
jgi:hypothetical protein